MKSKKLISNEIIRVKGNLAREKVISGLFNLAAVKAGSLAIGNEDTTFEYLITVDERMTNLQVLIARSIAQGIYYGVTSR